jgi:type I restriction enzyme M protein
MNQRLSKIEIENIVWRACDTFRGAIDPSEYKNYILTMLFVKYLSDLAKERRVEYSQRYGGDVQRIERAMSRERFVIPSACDFDYLYSKRESVNIGELINTALQSIEDENKGKLENVFRNIDFNSEPALGQTKDRNRRLKNLLEDFAQLDLQPSHLEDRDVIGDVYEYLIGRFAAGAGKKAGEFYTPPQVSTLLARLLNAQPGDKICDPACGSGSLLIKVAKQIGSDNFSLAGQESNGSTWALCKMNMFLHGMDSARIEWCDTINNPQLVQDRNLLKYNIVVANPPFSLDKWGVETAEHDKFQRFRRGVPPKSRGDYAFISHMVEATFEDSGKVGVIVPHGVLFRAGSEGKIRQKLIEENLLEAVIGLPPNLFYGTGIPAAILLFNRAKRTTDVLFIDASREFGGGANQNELREADIEKIVHTFRDFTTAEKYAHRATVDEIREYEFSLSIPRYVDTFEHEPEVDVNAVMTEIGAIEAQLVATSEALDRQLVELGLVVGGKKRNA